MGVSFDPPATNQAWATDEGFAFDLWTDDARALALHYGAADAPDDAAPARMTFLLEPSGEVALEYREGLDVATHPDDVLHDCRVLFGGG